MELKWSVALVVRFNYREQYYLSLGRYSSYSYIVTLTVFCHWITLTVNDFCVVDSTLEWEIGPVEPKPIFIAYCMSAHRHALARSNLHVIIYFRTFAPLILSVLQTRNLSGSRFCIIMSGDKLNNTHKQFYAFFNREIATKHVIICHQCYTFHCDLTVEWSIILR